jgi:hypothetical protein
MRGEAFEPVRDDLPRRGRGVHPRLLVLVGVLDHEPAAVLEVDRGEECLGPLPALTVALGGVQLRRALAGLGEQLAQRHRRRRLARLVHVDLRRVHVDRRATTGLHVRQLHREDLRSVLRPDRMQLHVTVVVHGEHAVLRVRRDHHGLGLARREGDPRRVVLVRLGDQVQRAPDVRVVQPDPAQLADDVALDHRALVLGLTGRVDVQRRVVLPQLLLLPQHVEGEVGQLNGRAQHAHPPIVGGATIGMSPMISFVFSSVIR